MYDKGILFLCRLTGKYDVNTAIPAPGGPTGPVQQLFQSVPLPGQTQPIQTVKKGSIIAFHYVGQTNHRIHDPYPLVLVSDIFVDMIRGVNLHYLTLPYVKGLVKTMANKPTFSYANIKGDHYIVGAFRSYKRPGISQLKMLDAAFLQKVLTVVRALDPGEIDIMRQQIHQMLTEKQGSQPVAGATGEMPVG
jgi:hypothetical protein